MLVDLAEDDNPEQLAHAIRLARARLALSEIRTVSRRKGNHKLSLAEINAEITAARAEGKRIILPHQYATLKNIAGAEVGSAKVWV